MARRSCEEYDLSCLDTGLGSALWGSGTMTRLPAATLPTAFCGPLVEAEDECEDFQGVDTGVCGGVSKELAPYKVSLAELAVPIPCNTPALANAC